MRKAKQMALGGVLAALAVTIMVVGGFIPFATYVCPVICAVMVLFMAKTCGKQLAWVWYAAVAILSILLGPDKEAAAVFLALGYYPIIQPGLEKLPVSILWKFLFFNIVTAVLYCILLFVVGLDQLFAEFTQLGWIGLAITLVLGNACFFLLDRALHIFSLKFSNNK